MLVYSWSTPSISASVIALPGIDDSSTRRNALPSVCPKPRSNGSITTLAWRGDVGVTLTTRGRRNSATADCMKSTLPDYLEYNSTTRLSLMSGSMSPRSGSDFRTPENFFSSTSTQSGKPTWARICSACAIRACF